MCVYIYEAFYIIKHSESSHETALNQVELRLLKVCLDADGSTSTLGWGDTGLEARGGPKSWSYPQNLRFVMENPNLKWGWVKLAMIFID